MFVPILVPLELEAGVWRGCEMSAFLIAKAMQPVNIFQSDGKVALETSSSAPRSVKPRTSHLRGSAGVEVQSRSSEATFRPCPTIRSLIEHQTPFIPDGEYIAPPVASFFIVTTVTTARRCARACCAVPI